ncbi:class I SAM-dependent methyltransferase [Natronosalvus halobius]|uniref:class I SAM-dependent methyltransferase n=1 Tax=Natronosalvus halobius TaxID=2953746 RepID=UPI00209CC538|nr:methyltransferase domain-containing protein [Natronosalvus halobius]USZ71383.1 methyltransferase domain-containing protein [Natronosalvus halobius]
MRAFSEAYLRRTREGMWADSREALSSLDLGSRERVLDVGCGSGELTRVLAEECPGEVVGCDVDRSLLEFAGDSSGPEQASAVPVVQGDAIRLPFADDSFDLVLCQALLINLPDPAVAVQEFARVSSDGVAAVEPDNGAVTVESTVPREAPLERRARRAYLGGIETDVTLGADAREVFESVGLEDVTTVRYDHDRSIESPYDDHALTVARRKATGAGLADDRATMLESDLTDEEYDDLRRAWREMGREVIEQMQAGTYERMETVPFYVTSGRVSSLE